MAPSLQHQTGGINFVSLNGDESMKPEFYLYLIHPAIAVVIVFPLIGIVTQRAWLTRQRRLQTLGGDKSKIPPVVGREHVQIGRWLAIAVVILTLLGLGHPIWSKIVEIKLLESSPFQVTFISLIFAFTLACVVFLNRSRQKLWRGIFATLTGMGVIILSWSEYMKEDGTFDYFVFHRTYEWYWSHFYYGIIAALLMIFSLAIVEDIYREKIWRNVHIALNCLGLLFFVIQGMTGVRDIFEIAFFKGLYMPPPS